LAERVGDAPGLGAGRRQSPVRGQGVGERVMSSDDEPGVAVDPAVVLALSEQYGRPAARV
jgi:hypothetical protein